MLSVRLTLRQKPGNHYQSSNGHTDVPDGLKVGPLCDSNEAHSRLKQYLKIHVYFLLITDTASV